jgi:DNA invertase Pin-like site-specific DNA recombinase
MLTVLGDLAEFERELIRTRMSEGAVANGVEPGRKAAAHSSPAARGDQSRQCREGNARRDHTPLHVSDWTISRLMK